MVTKLISLNQYHNGMKMASILSLTIYTSLPTVLILIMVPKSTSFPSYRSNVCSNTTSFRAGSDYQAHLNTVFNSLSSDATNVTGFSTAFSNTSTGEGVYGLFLCRGDLLPSECKDCVTTGVSDLNNKYCPNRKVAYIWYDECMVRYSNQSIFANKETSPSRSLWNSNNVTVNVTGFKEVMENMVLNVSTQAASNGSNKKRFFATKIEPYNSFQTLYALAQCTPDLTANNCYFCLTTAIQDLPLSQGGRVLQPSCNVRYESYVFFNSSWQSTPAAPPSTHNPNATTGVKPPGGKKGLSTGVIIAIIAPIVAITATLLLVGVCAMMNKKAKKYDTLDIGTGEDFSAFESLQYDLGTLQSATNNFSDENKLGEGGFGIVYKGRLPNGKEIAVKKLSINSTQGVQEFMNEASLVAKFQHRNLVRLMGFCLAGEEKLLVYEYVPNKSLDYFLFDPLRQGQLSWENRYKIIKGIARGVLYIHQDSQVRIIHRDLKASNILLDADMNPKISDFGLARIFGVDQTQGNTVRIAGTYGYMSPEYAMHGQFSTKSDVYSFGILVLEIISGKKNSSFEKTGDDEDLLSYAWRQWRDGLPLEFADPTIRESCSSQEVRQCLHLGLLCAQDPVDSRPTIFTIVLTLDSNSVSLPMPELPGFFIKSTGRELISSEASGTDQSSSNSMPWSVNDITMSEIETR